MATISPVMICNMALSHLGHGSRIESLDENSREAKECKLWYDYSRRAALSSFPWSFATVEANLSAHSEAPPDNWGYRYQYPATCLRAQKIVDELAYSDGDAIPFKVRASSDGRTKTILTDQDNAILMFTINQESTELFDPEFVQAFSFYLAHRIAFAITGKVALVDKMRERFTEAVMFAEASNANETVDRKPREAEHIRARY